MLSISPLYLLYFLPLLVVISLVYGATRHEDIGRVLRHAGHTAYWLIAFMGVIFAVLWLVGLLV